MQLCTYPSKLNFNKITYLFNCSINYNFFLLYYNTVTDFMTYSIWKIIQKSLSCSNHLLGFGDNEYFYLLLLSRCRAPIASLDCMDDFSANSQQMLDQGKFSGQIIKTFCLMVTSHLTTCQACQNAFIIILYKYTLNSDDAAMIKFCENCVKYLTLTLVGNKLQYQLYETYFLQIQQIIICLTTTP